MPTGLTGKVVIITGATANVGRGSVLPYMLERGTGAFDTTTALTAHAPEWLCEHPSERQRLSRDRDTLLDSGTQESLRCYTPAPGDGLAETVARMQVVCDEQRLTEPLTARKSRAKIAD